MKTKRTTPSLLPLQTAALALLIAGPASAVNVKWTDWIEGSPSAGTAFGTITTTTTTVNVSYSNPQGYGFLQNGVTGNLTNYYSHFPNSADITKSPFTSSVVDNDPPAAELVGLYLAGTQTLTFSETIANPFFAYVSLNGNGYAFDQDFEILSFGDGTVNDRGFWGPGTSYKTVVDLGGGNFEYQLLGTGEPHGTIRFLGSFDTVSWRSLSNEYWNGFTVGVEGTDKEVNPPSGVPEPGRTIWFLGVAVGLLGAGRRLGSRRA